MNFYAAYALKELLELDLLDEDVTGDTLGDGETERMEYLTTCADQFAVVFDSWDISQGMEACYEAAPVFAQLVYADLARCSGQARNASSMAYTYARYALGSLHAEDLEAELKEAKATPQPDGSTVFHVVEGYLAMSDEERELMRRYLPSGQYEDPIEVADWVVNLAAKLDKAYAANPEHPEMLQDKVFAYDVARTLPQHITDNLTPESGRLTPQRVFQLINEHMREVAAND